LRTGAIGEGLAGTRAEKAKLYLRLLDIPCTKIVFCLKFNHFVKLGLQSEGEFQQMLEAALTKPASRAKA
jgi:hypothetical protein